MFIFFNNKNFKIWFSKIKRILLYQLKKKKYVLVWIDDSNNIAKNIITSLETSCPNYNYYLLRHPREILCFPLNPKVLHIVILIVTDVTKLSENENERNIIQNKLCDYVKKGGFLLGTHDIIYRRTRNNELEAIFGCTITNFERCKEAVRYEINPEYRNHPLLSNLEDTFYLDDEEICWGEWNEDVFVLCKGRNSNSKDVPLFVYRNVGEGKVFWINSGDKNVNVCKSISKPQKEFVKLLTNIINYVGGNTTNVNIKRPAN